MQTPLVLRSACLNGQLITPHTPPPFLPTVQIMSDKFVTTPSEHFVEGQTVIAKVTNVDESKQRMLLSLRLSDCSLGDSASTSFLLLCQCLEELQGIRSLMSNQGGAC